MPTRIEIVYNEFEGDSRIEINGALIGSESMGIRVLLQKPFMSWINDLDKIIYDEVNDRYELTFVSGKHETELAKAFTLLSPHCAGFKTKANIMQLSYAQRSAFIEKLKPVIPGLSMLPKAIRLCIRDVGVLNNSVVLAQVVKELSDSRAFTPLSGARFRYKAISSPEITVDMSGAADYDIIVADSSGSAVSALVGAASKESLVIFPAPNKNGHGTVSISGCSSMFSYESDVVDRMIVPFIEHCFANYIRKASGIAQTYLAKSGNNTNFDTRAMAKCISRVEPYVEISMNQRVELKTSSPVTIRSYPHTDVTLKSDNSSVADCTASSIKGVSKGSTYINAYYKNTTRQIFRVPVMVYEVVRVNRILINAPDTMIENESAAATATLYPVNSENKDELRFYSGTPKILNVTHDGMIVAVSAGNGKIFAEVEGVTSSHSIQVKPVAKGISLSKDKIKLDMSDFSQKVTASIEPVNSVNGSIKSSVTDPSVLDYNQQTGIISPKSVGTTDIVFVLENNGKVISNRVCNVEITPTHPLRYEEPNIPQILSIIFTALFALFSSTLICIAPFVLWLVSVIIMLCSKEKHIALAISEFALILALFFCLRFI